jgi:long-chain fatty acid transport protein
MIIQMPHRSVAITLIAMSVSGTATASSFQILEQSPAHLGHAFAGTASNINDASTVFFNPAGMSKLKERQATVAGNIIFTEAKFNDSASTTGGTGGTGGKTDEIGLVPNLYAIQPINDQWTFGFGVNAPFGLASDYGDQWPGRYLATFSELQVININATFAYEVTEQLSLGIGINYQHADVTLESQVDSTLGVNPNPTTDSRAQIEGSDEEFVPDVSIYYEPFDDLRLGLVWRKGAKFNLEGGADFSLNGACAPGAGFPTGAPPAPTTGSICAVTLNTLAGNVNAQVHLPDTVTLSGSLQLAEEWTLHGDIAWTEWSNIQTVDVVNRGNNISVDELELYYDDTMRYALGLTYTPGTAWTWRAGVAIDEAPQTDPANVNPRIPDQDRVWLSVGFNYALSNDFSIDVGYAHLLVDDATINNLDMQTGHSVQGRFEPTVDIVGVQGNWRF